MANRPIIIAAILLLAHPAAGMADDLRKPLDGPDPARQALAESMRGHMATLNTILSFIAAERFEQAAQTAERELAVRPLPSAVAALPPDIQEGRESLGEAGKRLAAASRKAAADHSYFRLRKVTAALGEVTATCNMCHSRYRFTAK
jgi:cytochrome c556